MFSVIYTGKLFRIKLSTFYAAYDDKLKPLRFKQYYNTINSMVNTIAEFHTWRNNIRGVLSSRDFLHTTNREIQVDRVYNALPILIFAGMKKYLSNTLHAQRVNVKKLMFWYFKCSWYNFLSNACQQKIFFNFFLAKFYNYFLLFRQFFHIAIQVRFFFSKLRINRIVASVRAF